MTITKAPSRQQPYLQGFHPTKGHIVTLAVTSRCAQHGPCDTSLASSRYGYTLPYLMRAGGPAPAENPNGLWLNKELHRDVGSMDGRGRVSPGLHTSQWRKDRPGLLTLFPPAFPHPRPGPRPPSWVPNCTMTLRISISP